MGKKSRRRSRERQVERQPPWKNDTRAFEMKLRFAEHDVLLNDEISSQLKKIKSLRRLLRKAIEDKDEKSSHDIALYIKKASSFLKANICAKQRDELSYYANLEKYKGFCKMELNLKPGVFFQYMDDTEEFANSNVEDFCKNYIDSEKDILLYLKMMPSWYYKNGWWSSVREEEVVSA